MDAEHNIFSFFIEPEYPAYYIYYNNPARLGDLPIIRDSSMNQMNITLQMQPLTIRLNQFTADGTPKSEEEVKLYLVKEVLKQLANMDVLYEEN